MNASGAAPALTRRLWTLMALIAVAMSAFGCGRGGASSTWPETPQLGIPVIPTFSGCAANPHEPPIETIPMNPDFAITAAIKPRQTAAAKELPFLFDIDDGGCVVNTNLEHMTLEVAFKPSTAARVIQQVAGFLRSSGVFSSVKEAQ